jgi:hypothetical protein
MTRKNVLPATILVATALVFATVLVVPNSLGVASSNPCSTNGGDGGNGVLVVLAVVTVTVETAVV